MSIVILPTGLLIFAAIVIIIAFFKVFTTLLKIALFVFLCTLIWLLWDIYFLQR